MVFDPGPPNGIAGEDAQKVMGVLGLLPYFRWLAGMWVPTAGQKVRKQEK